ncbi:hypothetical protein [uncultured Veillonella sp.]|uniref:hypothetical protein n=1 Tax=uncultured Veillonella sp. TaxID=159268 RepID=UPI0025D9C00D|nr:hypothetical protein [uncultured Veillonella sp.]
MSAEIDKKMPISGGTFKGSPIVDNPNGWSNIIFKSDNGEQSEIEDTPRSSGSNTIVGFIRRDESGKVIANVRVPHKFDTLATLGDRTSIDGKVGATSLHSIMHRYPDNSGGWRGLSNPQWNQKGMFSCYFAGGTYFENQPTMYGQLINLPPSANINSQETAQIWIEQASGHIWFRGANGSTAGNLRDNSFKKVATIDDINNLSGRRYITEEAFDNGTGGFYRIWSDGWCEQGGYVGGKGSYNRINFYKAYRRNPIVVATVIADRDAYLDQYNANPAINNVTTTSFQTAIKDTNRVSGWHWIAMGYKA